MSAHAKRRDEFEQFARVEAPELDSPMYAELAAGTANDDELLALAARRQPGQPAPNMLFAAVQYLLLQGIAHPLAEHYPILSRDVAANGRGRSAAGSLPDPESPRASGPLRTRSRSPRSRPRSVDAAAVVQQSIHSRPESPRRRAGSAAQTVGTGRAAGRSAFPHFRAFCLEHRELVGELLATRRTQTQVVQRCTCLLPALGMVHREAAAPLALIDVGASAGLNLNFDRYAYRYLRDGREVLRWGRSAARVRLEADLRGPGTLPAPPGRIPVASRDGIDLNPIDLTDPDDLLWLRALIWPEHVERHAQLVDAAAEQKHSPVRLHRGDAARELPRLLDRVPAEVALVVYSTIALYQVPSEGQRRIEAALEARSRERPVWRVALEGLRPPTLTVTRYRDGAGETQLLAKASPHGWWIEWEVAPA